MNTIINTAKMEDLTSLDCCAEGRTVQVVELNSDDGDCCRLRELGVYEGARVTVVSGGDPVVLSIFANRFGVGRRCARNILVNAF